MFRFIVRYLGFLKHVQPLPFVFEGMMEAYAFLFNRPLLARIDLIERELSKWPGVQVGVHKYGGLQFDYRGTELGHIHGNALLDIHLSRDKRNKLIAEQRVSAHHVFKDSGWVSMFVRSDADVTNAIDLLQGAMLERAVAN